MLSKTYHSPPLHLLDSLILQRYNHNSKSALSLLEDCSRLGGILVPHDECGDVKLVAVLYFILFHLISFYFILLNCIFDNLLMTAGKSMCYTVFIRITHGSR